jgi:hypothetical protein
VGDGVETGNPGLHLRHDVHRGGDTPQDSSRSRSALVFDRSPST